MFIYLHLNGLFRMENSHKYVLQLGKVYRHSLQYLYIEIISSGLKAHV